MTPSDSWGQSGPSCVAVVLAGGESRRFGSDKLTALVAGQALLDRVLDSVPADWAVVVVGPRRTVRRDVRFLREAPPGGGPTAGLVAGLRAALTSEAEQVLVLPGDAPAAGRAAVIMQTALTATPSLEAIVGVDASGFEQPLQLALRRGAAAQLVAAAGDSAGHGARARSLVNQLRPPALRMTLSAEDHFDIDTTEQLAVWTARHSDAVTQIVTAVDGLGITGRPVLVALDGRSGAGKSTLAGGLALARPATVVAGDDFYSPDVAVLDDAQRRRLSDAEVADRVFDWRRLRAEALVPLRRGDRSRFAPFDWTAGDGRLGSAVELVPHELVVVEGVYSARPELADLVDLTVCVEVDAELRRHRLAARTHDSASWTHFWERGESFYFSSTRPLHSYDLVVAPVGS